MVDMSSWNVCEAEGCTRRVDPSRTARGLQGCRDNHEKRRQREYMEKVARSIFVELVQRHNDEFTYDPACSSTTTTTTTT